MPSHELHKYTLLMECTTPSFFLWLFRWYASCRFERDRVAGTVKISQQASAEKIVAKFGVTRGKPTPMVVGLRLYEFDQEEAEVEEPFRSLVGASDVAGEPNPP